MTNGTMTLTPHVEMVDVDFGAVLLDRNSGGYWELNEMGATVVHLGLSAVPRAAVLDSILSTFDVAPQQAEEDVDALVAALREAGLIEGVLL